MENEESFKSKKRQIWQWCIIIILAFFIVIQFSLAHCENQVLANQFTFASTISSIILSVIAIIMTVVSSDSVNNLLHKFRDLHGEIKDVPPKIERVVSQLNESMSSVSTNVVKMDNSISKMDIASSTLNNSVKNVDRAVANILKDLEIIKIKIESGFQEMKNEKSGGKMTNTESDTGLNDSENNLVMYSSVYGLYLIYAAILASDNNKKFSLRVLSEVINCDLDYLYGYFIAISSMGFIVYVDNEEDNKNFIFEIGHVKEGIKDKVKECLTDRITSHKGTSLIDQVEEFINEAATVQ